MKAGGYTPEKQITPEVTAIAMQMKTQIQAKMMFHYEVYVPVSFQTQVVAGTNYRIRIAVEDGKSIIATVYQALPCAGGALSLTEVVWL